MSVALEQALIGDFKFKSDVVNEGFTITSNVEKVIDIAGKLITSTNSKISSFGKLLFRAAKSGVIFTLGGASKMLEIFGKLLILIIWVVMVPAIMLIVAVDVTLLLIELAFILLAIMATIGIAVVTQPSAKDGIKKASEAVKDKEKKKKLKLLYEKLEKEEFRVTKDNLKNSHSKSINQVNITTKGTFLDIR
jgi:hypothetical protein